MIGKLIGVVDEISNDHILLNIAGVCYIIYTVTDGYNAGDNISLYTEYIPREDKITIYGFKTSAQKELFNILRAISGIAAKTSFNILATLDINDIIIAVTQQDPSLLCQVNGVGKKVANRIVSELKGKDELLLLQGQTATKETQANATHVKLLQDAALALESLGFKRAQTFAVLQNIINDNDNIAVEELVAQSLQHLGGN